MLKLRAALLVFLGTGLCGVADAQVTPISPPLRVKSQGVLVPLRYKLNILGGGNCVDNIGAAQTDCTFAVGGGGSASSLPVAQVGYGSVGGTSITSSSFLTYDATNHFVVTPNLAGAASTGGSLGLWSAESGYNSAFILGVSNVQLYTGGASKIFTWSNDGSYALPSSTAAAVAGGLRYNGTNLQYSDATTWVNIASVGGGTGNYTFSANTVDLTASGAMIIGSTNTTGITLGGTGSSGVTMNSGGFAMTFSPGNSGTINTTGVVLNLFANNVSTGWNINGSSGIITGFFGGSSIFQFDGGVGFYAAIDLNRSIGSSTKRWTQAWARQYAGVEQTVAAAATITVDPASGESIRVALGATAITAINGAAGFPGETIRVHFIQDATGTRTYAGFSVAANGFKLAAVVPTTTGYAAAKRDTYTFVWDSVAAFWIETGRTTNF